MSKFVRYTCNKKNEPTMREDCEKCSEYNPCAKDGKWCFVGALVAEAENARMSEDICQPISQDMAMPIMRDMSTILLPIGDGKTVAVLKENMLEQIEKDFYKSLGISSEMLGGNK